MESLQVYRFNVQWWHKKLPQKKLTWISCSRWQYPVKRRRIRCCWKWLLVPDSITWKQNNKGKSTDSEGDSKSWICGCKNILAQYRPNRPKGKGWSKLNIWITLKDKWIHKSEQVWCWRYFPLNWQKPYRDDQFQWISCVDNKSLSKYYPWFDKLVL